MHAPAAIGFDLFNTLLTVHPAAIEEAHQRLMAGLRAEQIPVENDAFRDAYSNAAKELLQAAHREGRETHNRFWISSALERLGCRLLPDDRRVARAVEAYFSAFYPHCRLLPGAREILGELAGRYRLGLLTNFTHGPAARKILDGLGLPPFFRVILISGELGYRKPHPYVFGRLLKELGVRADQAVFIGDDLKADVLGARRAGIRAVMATCEPDQGVPGAETLLNPLRAARPAGVQTISHWNEILPLLDGAGSPGV